MNTFETQLLVTFALINILSFSIMYDDKLRSRKTNTHRISEGMLFFLAAAFGSIGVYAGMFTLRHKTKKWYFLVGIPLIILQNIAFLFLIYLFFTGSLNPSS